MGRGVIEFEFFENLDSEVIGWYKLSPAERFDEGRKAYWGYQAVDTNQSAEPDYNEAGQLWEAVGGV
ncbi:MAG: hypothetical protein WA974_14640 [Thermodesulfobacteriota bacterium]